MHKNYLLRASSYQMLDQSLEYFKKYGVRCSDDEKAKATNKILLLSNLRINNRFELKNTKYILIEGDFETSNLSEVYGITPSSTVPEATDINTLLNTNFFEISDDMKKQLLTDSDLASAEPISLTKYEDVKLNIDNQDFSKFTAINIIDTFNMLDKKYMDDVTYPSSSFAYRVNSINYAFKSNETEKYMNALDNFVKNVENDTTLSLDDKQPILKFALQTQYNLENYVLEHDSYIEKQKNKQSQEEYLRLTKELTDKALNEGIPIIITEEQRKSINNDAEKLYNLFKNLYDQNVKTQEMIKEVREKAREDARKEIEELKAEQKSKYVEISSDEKVNCISNDIASKLPSYEQILSERIDGQINPKELIPYLSPKSLEIFTNDGYKLNSRRLLSTYIDEDGNKKSSDDYNFYYAKNVEEAYMKIHIKDLYLKANPNEFAKNCIPKNTSDLADGQCDWTDYYAKDKYVNTKLYEKNTPRVLQSRKQFCAWKLEWIPSNKKWLDADGNPVTIPNPKNPDKPIPLLKPLFDSNGAIVFDTNGNVVLDGKYGKIPYNAKTGYKAKSNDPYTWCDFKTACEAVEKYNCDGIGIFLDNKLAGIDMDHVLDKDGNTNKLASDILSKADTYTEVSPSGTGYRILLFSDAPLKGNKDSELGLECYNNARFLTLTGNIVKPVKMCSTEQGNELMNYIQDTYMRDKNVLTTLSADKKSYIQQAFALDIPETKSKEAILADALANGDKRKVQGKNKFEELYVKGRWEDFYASQSEADMYVLSKLAFFEATPKQAEELFQDSALYRENKWYKPYNSKKTIGQATLERIYGNPINYKESKCPEELKPLRDKMIQEGKMKGFEPKKNKPKGGKEL